MNWYVDSLLVGTNSIYCIVLHYCIALHSIALVGIDRYLLILSVVCSGSWKEDVASAVWKRIEGN